MESKLLHDPESVLTKTKVVAIPGSVAVVGAFTGWIVATVPPSRGTRGNYLSSADDYP